MTPEQKLDILNHSLERAAEELGDINALVQSRYYKAYPEAEEEFNRLAFQNRNTRSRMENSMIDSVLYCFMVWFEHPKEVDLTLQGASLQHTETKIPLAVVVGLLETTADVILSTVDRDDTETRRIWQELQNSLIEIMDQSTVTMA